MPGNSFGQALRLTTWGESHGAGGIGGILDGVPPGLFLPIDCIQHELDRRRPGANSFTSPRPESDRVEILSGVFNNKTLGTPIAFQVQNTNQQSKDYDALKNIFRPGHGDYSYQQKYGLRDHRGGGRSSARETIARIVGGAIAKTILTHLFGKALKVRAAVTQIGIHKINPDSWDWDAVGRNLFSCPDPVTADLWTSYLTEIKNQGRSVGALIEVHATGIPAGLGEPVFDKLDADLAKALMGINAVKGVEIGQGFSCVDAESGYDEMAMDAEKVAFLTNQAGGILAGISTGQPIVCRLAIKPTSSTTAMRQTVTTDGQNITTGVAGRHDPCIGIRAIPIVEAMVNLVLADHALRWRGQCGGIQIPGSR
ncbi:MAG: chorismate synthase [Alphaproteobacteria bacterium]|nr:chorismate synthase [Alphaproteobacteria bacterium]